MSVPEITPAEAKRLLDGPGQAVYLDVRTVAEFVAGHPPGALNIPVAEVNPMLGRMEVNPGFIETVRRVIPTDAQVVVGCKSGPRSEMAVQMMIAAGYGKACNLVGGFAGVVSPNGEVIEDGWASSGFPVERGDGGERSFASLSRTGA